MFTACWPRSPIRDLLLTSRWTWWWRDDRRAACVLYRHAIISYSTQQTAIARSISHEHVCLSFLPAAAQQG